MDGLQVRDGVRVDGGGSGWKKSEKKPAWRSCWKGKKTLISFALVHFWKWAGNKSTQVKWKTGSTVFRKKKKTHTLSQNRTFPANANTSWYLPHSISSKQQSVSVANILYDKQNNTWLLVDMEFLFSCSNRHLTHLLRPYWVKHSKTKFQIYAHPCIIPYLLFFVTC